MQNYHSNRCFKCFLNFSNVILISKKNVDDAMHFIYLHKYNIISAEDSSDMN